MRLLSRRRPPTTAADCTTEAVLRRAPHAEPRGGGRGDPRPKIRKSSLARAPSAAGGSPAVTQPKLHRLHAHRVPPGRQRPCPGGRARQVLTDKGRGSPLNPTLPPMRAGWPAYGWAAQGGPRAAPSLVLFLLLQVAHHGARRRQHLWAAGRGGGHGGACAQGWIGCGCHSASCVAATRLPAGAPASDPAPRRARRTHGSPRALLRPSQPSSARTCMYWSRPLNPPARAGVVKWSASQPTRPRPPKHMPSLSMATR